MTGVVALCCTVLSAASPRPAAPPVARAVGLAASPDRSDFRPSRSALSPHFPRETSSDAWFGHDKVKHLTTSFAAATMGYAALRTTGLDHRPAAVMALVGAGTLGVLKEAYDRAHSRPFSFRDLAWDALGVAIGAAMVDRTR